MEYKTRPHGNDSSCDLPPARQSQKKRAPTVPETKWGAVVVSATEFAEFEECVKTPQRPARSIIKGARLLRDLYK